MSSDYIRIHITSLADFPDWAAQIKPSHVVSMLAEDTFPSTPEGVEQENHLRLSFHDIIAPLPGCAPPALEHIERILAFGRRWQGSGSLISHCFAGVSRSSAAALILLAQANPGHEREAGALMRSRGPHVQPNRLMIEIADQVLGASGRLVQALDDMGDLEPLAPHQPFDVPVSLVR